MKKIKFKEIELQNCSVFEMYNLGDKLMIEFNDKIELAIVQGFTYNSYGELILVIDNFKTKDKKLNPFSDHYKIVRV